MPQMTGPLPDGVARGFVVDLLREIGRSRIGQTPSGLYRRNHTLGSPHKPHYE
jgi:hypothetical protein